MVSSAGGRSGSAATSVVVPDTVRGQTGFGSHARGNLSASRVEGGRLMADRTATGSFGLTLGGAIVIAGIVIAIFWSLVLGIIVALIGLLAFGGFAKGRWY